MGERAVTKALNYIAGPYRTAGFVVRRPEDIEIYNILSGAE